ncbi:phosphate ABC transporter substrate-binding protein PstS [Catenulispora sp. NF23]|uniref:Phosphate-binding protein n=2 Tax=Catenulispora pinistramenti TaxID=2705254 RepID=A0ABS5KX14_9ACTN|nr:phosphate ABC transporter substrate-binding protein PstS [Catenulispora pinistramenti]MBS2533935.1 phosphate ABC transporter substrate-binding protein PstS [Catenulispora pinistramenti]MBS2550616.1 phosphate ABC transporter substrate-binding protein PstS [Catenulispora pinistramenti]
MAGLTACGSDNNSSSSSSGGSSSTSSAAGGSTGSSSSSGSSSANIACANGTLTAQGSTAQQAALNKFVKDYQTKCGNSTNVSYNGTGSGPGVTAFTNKQADFAGSDFPLAASQQPAADQRCGSGSKALSVGTIPGVIAVMYNIPNVSKLNLSASTLAKIFNSKITKWNDAAIAQENPGVNLPDLTIQTFHRSDGSGTSYNFSNYLNKTAASDFPAAANKQWPGSGGQGQQGSKGVAQAVQSTSGGIGYAEVSYATSNHLNTANIGNAAGKFVPLTIPNAANFLNKAKVDTTGGNYLFNFDYTYSADDAYPAVLVTYEIVCSTGNESSKLPELKGFLGYLASDGAQSQLPNLGYVSLSSDQESAVAAIYSGLS